MSHSHQSQANLLTCDNEFSLLAKVSGHRNEDVYDDNLSANIITKTSKHNIDESKNCNNFNFSRVSLKAIKSRIKMSNSHSLTFSQSSSLLLKSSNKITNQQQQQSHDSSSCNIITNNSDSIDCNNKNLIKSKSITNCLTKDVIDGEVDVAALGDDNESKISQCNESRVNSINYQSERFIHVDDTRQTEANLLKKQIDKEDEADNDEPLGYNGTERNDDDDTNQYSMRTKPTPKLAIEHSSTTTTTNIKSDFPVTDERDDKSMMMAVSSHGKQTAAISSSSCSSSSTTSNENNNEVVACKADRRKRNCPIEADASARNEPKKNDDETKLLNVNHGQHQNTNPFLGLEYDTMLTTDAEVPEAPAKLDDEDEQLSCKGDSIEPSRLRKLKRPKQPSKEDFNNDELDITKNNGGRRRAATMTTMGTYENDLSQATMLISNCNNGDNTNSAAVSSHIIKSAIPTRAFQRQDYLRPGEDDKSRDINNIEGCVVEGEKREKKLFKLGKKSGNLFHIPTFGRASMSCGKPMTPSMRHVSLHYPSKTSTIVDCSSEKRSLGSLPSRAKYQLIKLGQKCKILTHHHQPAPITTTTTTTTTTAAASMATMPRLGAHTRMSVIKTSKHQKRHYYNEVNKSYHLDDFIRKTHLLNNMLANDEVDMDNDNGYYDDDDDDAIVGYQFDCDEDDCVQQRQQNMQSCSNNVVYKSYKSEIDLTRNLTYLDAFLNEHFEPSSYKRSPRQHRHKRTKSSTKNINYLTKNVHRHNPKQQDESDIFSPSTTMINDGNFDDIDDMIEEQKRGQASFCDGNVTSSSFEYSTVIKAGGRKQQRDLQDLINVGRSITTNTATSSSMSSSDYASVFSNGSKEATATKSKLISTPEEQHQEVESHDITKLAKVKKSRARRSSQPIPELTNAIENENEQFLLFDDAKFSELKRSMKTLHPDLYNSVPHFEDINAVDFMNSTDANFCHYNGDSDANALLINPFSVDTNSTSAISKRQLSSSYNIDSANIHHRDYLEHFQQQQMLGQQQKRSDGIDSSGYMAAFMRNGIRPRTSTYSSSSSSTNHHHNEISPDSLYQTQHNLLASPSDLYGARKVHSQSISSTSSYGPHRVLVSKSKKQKGELVLEYEC